MQTTDSKNDAPAVTVDEFGVQRVNGPHSALMWDPSEPDNVRLYDGVEVGSFERAAVCALLPALRTFAEHGALIAPPAHATASDLAGLAAREAQS